MGTLEIIGIILLIAGFVLAGIEMYLPGFGLPGILGGACLILGIIFTAKTIEQGLLMTIIVVCVLLLIMIVILLLFLKVKKKSSIILDETLTGSAGYLDESDLQYLLGKEGIAATDLKPSGKGNFEGIEFDVYSESKYILKGQKIKICSIKNSRLTVRED